MTTLFVELALIRWTSANDVFLAEIPNYVLLASFLGIGVGFLMARRHLDLFRLTPVSLGLLVAFALLTPVKMVTLSGSHRLQGLAGSAPLPEWVGLPVLFVLAGLVMAGLGQGMARQFICFESLDAYRWDILGSLGGIAAFSALSFIGLPPAVWGSCVAVAFLAIFGIRQRWWQLLGIAAMVAMLVVESAAASGIQVWSPYYKINARPLPAQHALEVSANNIPFQTVYPISELRRIQPYYFLPYRHTTAANMRKVLVIGAGTGNDVAVALAHGARRVTGVEIDPELIQLGRRYNPEHAYQNPRVTIHQNDGRAFLQDSSSHYSLILYALPDARTTLTGQAAPVTLDDYLLTTQAIQAAKAHLAPNGVFSMYNYYQPFLLRRYATELYQVFGRKPCVEIGGAVGNRKLAVLTEAASGPAPNCTTYWNGRPVSPATDNHPFPYLPKPGIPTPYLLVIGFVLALSVLATRVAGGPLRLMAGFADLFFMGAAFMLLETKNIVQFALLFGTTWYVNSLVFAGVLVSVYLAVEVARHVRLPRPPVVYAALLGALITSYLMPQESLLGLPVIPRFLAATALAFAPVFLANLVFAQRFQHVSSSTVAFGSNLLGALMGGILEYLSLLTGFKFLLVVVAVLYAMAFVFGRHHLVQQAGAA
ncbi:MAG: spermine/spermidine synthase domain-containing protein [Acidimicrobiales bacterium]